VGRVLLFLSLLATFIAVGTTAAAATSPPSGKTEVGPSLEVDTDIPNSQSAAHVPSSHVPRPTSTSVDGSTGTSILGLNFADTRTADGGNQFSLEPPDQGLCVGDNGYVMEAVNDVFTFYQGGSRLYAPMALNPFFTQDHAVVRSNPPVFGTFISDPKCYFDPDLKRFFFTVVSADTNPATGDLSGPTHVEIAVSKSSTPTTSRGDWYFYRLTTTDTAGPDASTPYARSHPGCPCLPDQPLIGADKYGFFVATNEFTDVVGQLVNAQFNGAMVYAMDKAALANGSLHNVSLIGELPPLAEGPGYSIQPATSPTTADWQTANNGTEYFLSALDFNGTLDDRVAVWSATNTQSLTTNAPNAHLSNAVLSSEVYGQPPKAIQKPGPTPLAAALKEHENLLDSNDDRMNQVVYVRPGGTGNGYLASGVNTVVKTENGPTHVGIAWFVVQPSAQATATSAINGSVTSQGYTSVNQQNVMYPAIGLNHAGKGAMVFTLVGPGYYPSAAFVPFSATSGAGSPVYVARLGQKPADGFTGYRFYEGNGVERWGDYSAAVADAAGAIWMGTEYIEGDVAYPPFIANWDTRLINYTP
jgi:hypothetical protein